MSYKHGDAVRIYGGPLHVHPLNGGPAIEGVVAEPGADASYVRPHELDGWHTLLVRVDDVSYLVTASDEHLRHPADEAAEHAGAMRQVADEEQAKADEFDAARRAADAESAAQDALAADKP